MKIVFFVHRYWPEVGGVEKYVDHLARALARMGHEVDVVAGATVEGLAEREVHEGVRIHRFPARRSPLRCRWWLWRNRFLFAQADVIHVSDTHMLEYLWRMIGFLLDRRKVFLTRHGMSCIYPVPEDEKRRARRARSMASGLVHDGAFIEKWLGIKPDLCPDQGLNPPADALAPVPEPPPTSAIYIGRLEPDTGIEVYVEAVRLLTKDSGRPFRLDVYGDGSLAPELGEIAEREHLDICFHGRVPDAQNRIVDACFAFLDGRMAIQEAMARRRLVLAAYTDPLKRDYVSGERFGNYLIAMPDAEKLAAAVEYHTAHLEERMRLVAEAFEYARTLTWERTAQAYERLWRERLRAPVRAMSRWAGVRVAWTLNREPLPS